jgi:hypothetical protein
MRVVVVLVIGLAIGFGAGYVAFEEPISGDDGVTAGYVEDRLERSEILVKSSTCTKVGGSGGKRWTCEAIAGLPGSANFALTYDAIVQPDESVVFGRR